MTEWLPDGVGLPDEAFEIIEKQAVSVHLRLTAPDGRVRGACEQGLGEWWTGLVDEVTCKGCREVRSG